MPVQYINDLNDLPSYISVTDPGVIGTSGGRRPACGAQ